MKIRNWSKFQHFKDRRPPWIKLHRDILDQRDIMLISSCSFRLLILLWLLASEDETMEGNLPSVPDISFRLRIPESEINKHLQELTKWVDGVDIKVISERYQDGLPETETETETETYKKETEKSVIPVKQSRPRTVKVSDEEWTIQIKENPAYNGIDIDTEIHKCQAWCMTKGKVISRARILNWLNRSEKPFSGSIQSTHGRIKTFADHKEDRANEQMRQFVEGV